MKHFTYKFLVGLTVISLTVAAGLLVGDYFLTRERLPYNTYVGAINVSLLTQSEATQKLKRLSVNDLISSPLVVYYKEKDFFLLPSELGLAVDIKKSVGRAFKKTHEKHYLKELQNRLSKETLYFSLILKADDKKLEAALENIKAKIDQTSQEATIVLFGKGAYNLKRQVVGRSVKVKASAKKIKEALAKDERLLPLVVTETQPRIKYEDLVKAPPVQLLSTYTTYYGSHDSKNRIHNIKLIAKNFIDKTILLPNDDFSLLKTVGDFSLSRGFRQAFVIVDGELEPQFGGGTCQIATTLYNAVLLADLEVLQRKNHSLYFYIYPLGRDATVYSPGLDFKFKNNTGNPLYIKAIVTSHSLTFKIFGTPTGKTVTFKGPYVTYREKKGTTKSRWRIPKNTPFSTRIIRTVKKNGKIIKKEIIRSYYKLVGDGNNVVIRRPEP